MVHLKSFRFIEPEGPTEQQVDSNTSKSHQDNESPKRTTSLGPSRPSSSSSADSAAVGLATPTAGDQLSASSWQPSISVAGGNLTTDESSQPDISGQFDESGRKSSSSSSSSDNSTNTTLSTNEELQQSKYDIVEEENSDELNVADGETRINMEIGPSIDGAKGVGEDNIRGKRQSYTKSPNAPKTPLSPRVQPRFGGAPLAQSRPLSPVFAARQAKLQGGDNISQYSFGQNKANNGNHFEIRWRNVNLMARRSKLPKIIANNPLYKLFKAKQDPALDEKIIYHLPPNANERVISVIPELGQPELKQPELQPPTAEPINNQQEFRPILSNISGSVFSGQLTAILGPSGVGKTSLLNSLTGRNTLEGTGRVSLLGGASKRMSVVNVPQADVLPEKLTTQEDLRFTSRLKNPQKGFNHERNIERIVRHLQMEKFLNTRIDKLSGGEARRLSIGRELLSSPDIMILDEPTSGLDANTCKKIITALRDIVEHSDNILDRPMAIIVTIHQPQQEVLNLFHRLYIMAVGGCAIYEGPPSNLFSHLVEYSSLSAATNIQQLNENPAIVAIEVASCEYGPNIIAELADYHELNANEYYANDEFGGELSVGQSPYLTPRSLRNPRKSPMSVSPRFDLLARKAHSRRAGSISLDGLSMGAGKAPPRTPILQNIKLQHQQFDRMSSITSLSYASTYDADLPEPVSKLKVDKRLRRSVVMKGDFLSHTLTLMSRCWLLTTRDLFLMAIRIVGFLLVAAGIVQIFSNALDQTENQCPVYQSEVDDIISFMGLARERLLDVKSTLVQAASTHTFFFHLILCITIISSALTGLVFPLQMRMFIREYKNGWYSASSFVASSTLAELPIDMIGPTLTILIVYPLCNQPPSEYHWRELGYILVTVLGALICKSQAQIVGAYLMKSVENSVFLSCVVVTPPALLSGVAIRVSQMPHLLQWLSYGSFLRYAFECLFLLRYGYGLCPCDPEIVNGYPVRPTPNAIPERLDNFARGVLEFHGTGGNFSMIEPIVSDSGQLVAGSPVDEFDDNLFVRYIRLVSDAGNMFVTNAQELGHCDKYRSLYLLNMGIQDHTLVAWTSILVLMFILSRFITYFVIRTVIKTHRE